MQDDVASCLDRCRKMDFEELAGFIVDRLDRVHGPDPYGDQPHSKEEFRTLWRLLREKHEAMKPDPSPPLSPLEEAYRKRARTEWHLDNMLGALNTKKRDIAQMRKTIAKLDQKIEEMLEAEEYESSSEPTPETPTQARRRIASQIFEDIEKAFAGKLTRRRLQWRPARPGSLSVEDISRYYRERQHRDPALKYDMARIEKAYELKPDGPPYEGPDGFDGYVIFTYPDTGEKALMECPEVGNAAYVIHKDWENWSQMDKQELMAEAEQGGEVTRIPHQGDDWFDRIKRELGKE